MLAILPSGSREIGFSQIGATVSQKGYLVLRFAVPTVMADQHDVPRAADFLVAFPSLSPETCGDPTP